MDVSTLEVLLLQMDPVEELGEPYATIRRHLNILDFGNTGIDILNSDFSMTEEDYNNLRVSFTNVLTHNPTMLRLETQVRLRTRVEDVPSLDAMNTLV